MNGKPEWWDQAHCRTGDGQMLRYFFPDRGDNFGAHAVARSLCYACPVFEQCREWAVECETGPWGMFGGLTPTQRQEERRRRRTAA